MTRTYALIALALLTACGGGGVETKVNVAPEKALAVASTDQAAEAPQNNYDLMTPDQQAEAEKLNYDNFKRTTLEILVPNDLIGSISVSVSSVTDGLRQDYFMGSVNAGNTLNIPLELPNIVSELLIEYIAFDPNSGFYENRIVRRAVR